jgi:glucose-1-phosphate thymidylyltransferase
MKAIILCAGFGSRLGELGKKNSKALFNIAGQPLINWIVGPLINLDFVEEVIVLHNQLFKYNFEHWLEGLEDKRKISLINNGVSRNEDRIGAIGDVERVLRLKSIYSPVVLFPGDTVFTFDVKKFFYEIKRNPENGWLSLRTETSESKRRKCGVVGIGESGKITSFEEKPKVSTEELVYKGPCYLPPTITKILTTYCSSLSSAGDLPDNIGSFLEWATAKFIFKGCIMRSGECIDVGSLSDYRVASGRIKRSLGEEHGEGYML